MDSLKFSFVYDFEWQNVQNKHVHDYMTPPPGGAVVLSHSPQPHAKLSFRSTVCDTAICRARMPLFSLPASCKAEAHQTWGCGKLRNRGKRCSFRVVKFLLQWVTFNQSLKIMWSGNEQNFRIKSINCMRVTWRGVMQRLRLHYSFYYGL